MRGSCLLQQGAALSSLSSGHPTAAHSTVQADPFVVEALFPLFELLHHYWINQPDRDSALQELGRQLAPSVFGTPMQHSLPAEDAGLLSDTGA